jgi:hypothetical protein
MMKYAALVIRQLLNCVLLIGVFGLFAKLAPDWWRDLWRRLVRGLSALARHRMLSWVGLGALVLAVRMALPSGLANSETNDLR